MMGTLDLQELTLAFRIGNLAAWVFARAKCDSEKDEVHKLMMQDRQLFWNHGFN
jgi:hypothetical protein